MWTSTGSYPEWQYLSEIQKILEQDLPPQEQTSFIKHLLLSVPSDGDIDPTAKKILLQVCSHLNLSIQYVRSKGKQRDKVYARQLYCFVVNKKTTLTQPTIVYPFNVSYKMFPKYKRTLSDLLSYDDKVREDVRVLMAKEY
jgi:chromosomal replication initiation ATPase DnaA